MLQDFFVIERLKENIKDMASLRSLFLISCNENTINAILSLDRPKNCHQDTKCMTSQQ